MDAQPEASKARRGLSDDEQKLLDDMVRRLVAAYAPERIYLFGSRARGDVNPHSDFDLMIVVPDGATAERKRSRIAYECLWETRTAADVLVWSRSSFDGRAGVRSSLPATVLREGILLYAA